MPQVLAKVRRNNTRVRAKHRVHVRAVASGLIIELANEQSKVIQALRIGMNKDISQVGLNCALDRARCGNVFVHLQDDIVKAGAEMTEQRGDVSSFRWIALCTQA